MARGTPAHTIGANPAGGDSRGAFLTAFEAALLAYNSGNSWSLYDNYTESSTNYRVYKSVGDPALGSGALKGDTQIYIMVYVNTGPPTGLAQFRAYQDWSTLTHTGRRVSGDIRFLITNTATDAAAWWITIDNYGFAAILTDKRSATGTTSYGFAAAGALVRPFAAGVAGVARLSVDSSGTGTVDLSVDRDLTGQLQPGQFVHIYNNTPVGETLAAEQYEFVPVVSVSSDTIRVSGVVYDGYKIGSLVGLDPIPTWLSSVDATSPFPDYIYTVNNRNGAASGASYTMSCSLRNYPLWPAECDPDFDGVYGGWPAIMNALTQGTAPAGYRGSVGQLFRYFALSTLISDQQVVRADFDATQRYIVFPSVASMLTTRMIGLHL